MLVIAFARHSKLKRLRRHRSRCSMFSVHRRPAGVSCLPLFLELDFDLRVWRGKNHSVPSLKPCNYSCSELLTTDKPTEY